MTFWNSLKAVWINRLVVALEKCKGRRNLYWLCPFLIPVLIFYYIDFICHMVFPYETKGGKNGGEIAMLLMTMMAMNPGGLETIGKTPEAEGAQSVNPRPCRAAFLPCYIHLLPPYQPYHHVNSPCLDLFDKLGFGIRPRKRDHFCCRRFSQ